MRYLPWALLALVAYSAVPPLMSVATTGEVRIPSDVAALLSNAILVTGTLVVVHATGERVVPYLDHAKLPYVAGAGAFLTVGILAYYRALARGPVSVVTPIFGMFLVLSSVVGFLFLDEPFTVRKALGILLAVAAVYLVTS
jgi:transporter family protein